MPKPSNAPSVGRPSPWTVIWWILLSLATAATYAGTTPLFPGRKSYTIDPSFSATVMPPAMSIGFALLLITVSTVPKLTPEHTVYAQGLAWMAAVPLPVALTVTIITQETFLHYAGVTGATVWWVVSAATLLLAGLLIRRTWPEPKTRDR